MGATDLSVLPQRSIVFPETVFRGLAPADVPLRVEGVVSQTGNLTEWRDSNGLTLTRVSSSGQLLMANATGIKFDGGALLTSGPAGGSVWAIPANASSAGLIVKGVAGQSNNLQEWQNSASAVMTSISSAGWLTAPGVAVDGDIQILSTSRRTIYPVNGNVDLQIRSGGTGTLQLNADNNGPVFFGGGAVTMQGSLKVIQDTANQGNNTRGLMVGNDLWIYDVNVANAIGFSGAGNPEAATIYLGRVSNVAPRISGNDVNKTLSLAGDNPGGASQVIVGSVAINGGTPQLTLQGQSGATGSNHTNFMRFEGLGVRHGEVTWHPAESYFRFRTTGGAAFDGWAYLLANQFYAQSTEASKENIQTVDLAGYSGVREIRREAKTGAPEAPLSERFKNLRPVSYRSKGDPKSPLHHSFVAEEAFESVPEIVALDGDGNPTGINLMATISILTAMVQDQQKKIEALEARL